jgi:hydrogenase assembly chaperone HypC/HupF
MCLAYPARVVSVDQGSAIVDARDRCQRVVLLALDSVAEPGDWLLIQSGLALAVIDAAEAERRRHLLATLERGLP